MKSLNSGLVPIAVALITGACSVPAFANTGPYVGAQFGINDARDQTFQYNGQSTLLGVTQPPVGVELPLVPNSGTAGNYQFERNVLGELVVGYSYAIGLRPEFELSLRRERASSITNPDGSAGDTSGVRLSTTSGLFNLWYDFFPSWKIHPYLGAGAGVSRLILNNFQSNVPVAPRPRKSDDTAPSWQYGAGIRWDIFPQVTIGIDYRRLTLFRKANFYPYERQPQTFVSSGYTSQSLLFSVEYYFFAPAKPAAVAEPAPVQVVEPVAAPAPVDTDGDGVTDDLDQCPNTPAGVKVDASGCPLPPPPPPCKTPAPGEKVSLAGCGTGDHIVLRGVNFDTNKATLTLNAKTLLNDVASELKAFPTITVEIDGHTDSVGSDSSNQKLSDRRSASVRAYLVEAGIAANRMTTAGFGESQPIADNGTPEGRETNRRVELKITGGSGSTETTGASP